MDAQLWQELGIALGLGLLVGLQREWVEKGIAGIRTFSLITLLGTVCALLSSTYGGWIVAAGLLAVGALLAVAHIQQHDARRGPPGLTTEMAALLMFVVGALIPLGHQVAAIAIGGSTAVLLQWKQPLHGFVRRIGQEDLRAVFRLVLLALVVLPLLPDRTFDPYEVLNPFRIWRIVVLIVGISVGGYLTAKYVGARIGSVLGGIFGGLISSTATTVSYARRSRALPEASSLAAMVIMIASTVVYLRVALEVVLVAPAIAGQVLPPLAAMAGWMGLLSVIAAWRARSQNPQLPTPKDPSELMAAVAFGALYALVLLSVAAAREHLGNPGLYLVAALSGLTDMDAITLSTAQMIDRGQVAVATGWRMMLVGSLSNILFKGLVIGLLGHRQLLKSLGLLFGLALAGGTMLIVLWPAA